MPRPPPQQHPSYHDETRLRHPEPSSHDMAWRRVLGARNPVHANENAPATTTPQPLVSPRKMNGYLPLPEEIDFTNSDWESLYQQFPDASEIFYDYPYFIFIGASPPKHPITIKGLIVEFYETLDQYTHVPGEFGKPDLPDPLPPVEWTFAKAPSPKDLKALALQLEVVLSIDIVTMSFYDNIFVIEVLESSYDANRLPGRVAGRRATWGVEGRVWKLGELAVRKVTPDPSMDIRDESKYDPVQPGVQLVGSLLDTSSGAMIRNKLSNARRMTAAAHGSDDNDGRVIHGGIEIGVIKERFPAKDWALVELNNNTIFRNSAYFDAPVPHRLIGCDEVTKRVTLVSYFGCDGFTTGLVCVTYAGLGFQTGKGTVIRMASDFAYIMRRARGTHEEVGRIPADGLCGAPVVHQESDDQTLSNAVCGFFWLSNYQVSWVIAVDPLISEGWELVPN